jgi:hypothetical protein
VRIPSIRQPADGCVYLPAGKSFSGIFEITGLDTFRRLPEQRLTVTAEHVAAARRYQDSRSKVPQKARPKKGTEKDKK